MGLARIGRYNPSTHRAQNTLNRTLRVVIACLLVVAAGAARSQLTIEITGGGGNQIPIAIAPFQGEAQLQPGTSDVVEGDLARSGRFRTL